MIDEHRLQVGDLVEFSDEKTIPEYDNEGNILYYRSEISPYNNLMILNSHFVDTKIECRIIERNGVPFPAPEEVV